MTSGTLPLHTTAANYVITGLTLLICIQRRAVTLEALIHTYHIVLRLFSQKFLIFLIVISMESFCVFVFMILECNYLIALWYKDYHHCPIIIYIGIWPTIYSIHFVL